MNKFLKEMMDLVPLQTLGVFVITLQFVNGEGVS